MNINENILLYRPKIIKPIAIILPILAAIIVALCRGKNMLNIDHNILPPSMGKAGIKLKIKRIQFINVTSNRNPMGSVSNSTCSFSLKKKSSVSKRNSIIPKNMAKNKLTNGPANATKNS